MKQLYIFRYTTPDNKTKKKPVLASSFSRAIKVFYGKPERVDAVLHRVDLADSLSRKLVKHFQR